MGTTKEQVISMLRGSCANCAHLQAHIYNGEKKDRCSLNNGLNLNKGCKHYHRTNNQNIYVNC
jgi:hypothetical protein